MNEMRDAVAKIFQDRNQAVKESDNSFLPNLVSREIAKGRMPITGNHAIPPSEGRPAPPVIGDPPAIMAKLAEARVLLPKERFTQFVARTGAGLDFIRKASKSDLIRFCEIVAKHEPSTF
jgi:hypothetical protein